DLMFEAPRQPEADTVAFRAGIRAERIARSQIDAIVEAAAARCLQQQVVPVFGVLVDMTECSRKLPMPWPLCQPRAGRVVHAGPGDGAGVEIGDLAVECEAQNPR